MASYYHNHQHMTPTQISNNDNLHTLLLMNNPDLATQHHQQQQQVPSNNILLLNSAAAAAAFSQPSPPIFPHHLVRLPPPGHNEVTLYGYPQEAAARDRQGLSLSLSQNNNNNDNPLVTAGQGQVSVLGSKYLRATQELLEEVVNVGDTLTVKSNGNDHCYSTKKGKATVSDNTPSEGREKDCSGGDGDGDSSHRLSTVERHDIQMKKAKLVTMLDEAEQRYRHYNNQMQMVIESFESGAGMGSAKTYTSLALKTISKQFRCLKDAIQGQIRAANKSLGEDDGGSFGGKIEGSRLKFIDHQIRQQRALQQLGMIQSHNAWRPQRGLPERSVSVLRAWLFEHFLHPYPKDSDKILLAKQTGLTRGQVSNWFINARVRLWKPMIEEMYNEELKEQEKKGSEEKPSSKENSNNEEIGDMTNIGETPSSTFMSVPTSSVFTLNNGSAELEGVSEGNPKRQRSNNNNQVVHNGEILIKFGNDEKERRDNNNGYPIIPEGMNFMGGYGNNNMGDLGRFETEEFNAPRYVQGNGGISLSLGLPPSCENHQQFNSITETSHTFISPNQSIRQFQHGTDFEFIDIQNRKGFAAQLLPDFAA